LILSSFGAAVRKVVKDPAEKPPPWSIEMSENVMNELGISKAILSLSTPGVTIAEGQAARDLARHVNQYAAKLRDTQPTRFGFFASLPSLLDIEGALAEITYVAEHLQPDGFVIYTRYGGNNENAYLGDAQFRPIWQEFNARKAVVFVHPTAPLYRGPFPPTIMLNITEFPHETTRTAVDLIFSNTKRDFPDCKVILSHAGGTLPYLMGRITLMELLSYAPGKKTREEIIADARSFYYDIALSGNNSTLKALFELVPEDHILYGSDFPYCPIPGLQRMNDIWESFTPEKRDLVNFRNAERLFDT
jgi:predicted TIM-barrel fold metal-dependent hydrolase